MPDPREHDLFRRYPLRGEVTLSTGTAPTPYHVYNGHLMLIGGSVDLPTAQDLTAGQDVSPIATTDGRGLMAIWLGHFIDASLGAHLELQFSLLVAHEPLAAVPAQPFALLKLLAQHPAARLLCHGLWNTTLPVVAYNREYLGLRARLASGSITRAVQAGSGGRKSFAFQDTRTGQAIISGSVGEPSRTPAGAMLGMLRTFGPRGMAQIARQPCIEAPVVNMINSTLPRNADAPTVACSDHVTVQRFHPRRDDLTIAHNTYAALNFTPRFVEHLTGFRFVYLHPDDLHPDQH